MATCHIQDRYVTVKATLLKHLLIIFSIFFISCESNNLGDDQYTVIEYGNNHWKFMFDNCTPSDLNYDEILEIESIIGQKISEHKKLMSEWDEELSDAESEITFRRQYVPVILDNGEKAVWINFLCGSNHFEDWKENLVIVSDGGPCFFQLKVNLNRKEFYDYRYNGIAFR